MSSIHRKIVHIKVRPTYTNINNLSIYLKNLGYSDIPKIQYDNNNFLSKEAINNFCNKVEEMLKCEPTISDKKRNHSLKEIFMFKESSLLPKNVYVSEKDNEENLEDDIINNDISSISESENSNSEKEDNMDIDDEEGYELYNEVSDEEFSD